MRRRSDCSGYCHPGYVDARYKEKLLITGEEVAVLTGRVRVIASKWLKGYASIILSVWSGRQRERRYRSALCKIGDRLFFEYLQVGVAVPGDITV